MSGRSLRRDRKSASRSRQGLPVVVADVAVDVAAALRRNCVPSKKATKQTTASLRSPW